MPRGGRGDEEDIGIRIEALHATPVRDGIAVALHATPTRHDCSCLRCDCLVLDFHDHIYIFGCALPLLKKLSKAIRKIPPKTKSL